MRGRNGGIRRHVVIVVIVGSGVPQVGVLVIRPSIEQAHVLCPYWNGQVVLNGMEADKVADDVPLDGLDECLPAALQTLEEVRAAESFQSRARA